MRPDPQQHVLAAIMGGPDYCPPDLFAGRVEQIVLGLKAHANTIAHARHIALEDTYPRTRRLIGPATFHAAAARHLADPAIWRRSLARLGMGLADHLTGGAKDVARVEWAGLEAHGSADADPFDLDRIAALSPARLIACRVVMHPAARTIFLGDPAAFVWGTATTGSLPGVVVSRPRADTMVTSVSLEVLAMADRLRRSCLVGDLLESDPAATQTLITCGA